MGSTKTADEKIKAISGNTDKFNYKLSKIKGSGLEAASGVSMLAGTLNKADDKLKTISGSTEKLSSKLKKIEGSSGAGASGVNKLYGALKRLATIYFTVQAVKKGMSTTDSYINTVARLNMINDGLQTSAELQDKIFGAAERSRGSYSDMAQNVSKMGLLAKDAFKSNDELIAFTELIQKSFKVGGASTQEQQSGIYQLTQAMAAGKLQGDEFRSIMENATMIADAIAKFTGKSKGELKKMSSEGTITADVIKNAMFAMSKDINSKFDAMPKNFSDISNQIQNKAIRIFEPVMQQITTILNNPSFDKFINSVMFGIGLTAILFQGITWLLGLLISNWNVVEPILLAISIILSVWAFQQIPLLIAKLWLMLSPIFAQAGAWLLVNWPILLIMVSIGLLLYAMIKFGDETIKVFGFIGGAIGVVLAIFNNLVAAIWNGIIGIAEGISNLFVSVINSVLKGVNWIIKAMNKIPGVNIDTVSEMKKDDFSAAKMQYKNIGEAWDTGKLMGEGIGTMAVGGVQFGFDKLTNIMRNPSNTDLSAIIKNGALPVSGKDGKLKVDMSQEDLKYLQDIAEREYINKFSTATLAPNITIRFGNVTKEADADQVAKRVGKILREEIAMVAEGVYS